MEDTGDFISTGQEALKSVANETGKWNWALVGADPDELPLAGGGSGGVAEMEQCLEALGDAVLGGLLRVQFGQNNGDALSSKWVMVFVTIEDNTALSAVQRGKAVARRPCMEKAIRQYCTVFQGCMQITHVEDFTHDAVVARIKSSAIIDGAVVVPFYEPPPPIEEMLEILGEEEEATAEEEDGRERVETVEYVRHTVIVPPEEEALGGVAEEERPAEEAAPEVTGGYAEAAEPDSAQTKARLRAVEASKAMEAMMAAEHKAAAAAPEADGAADKEVPKAYVKGDSVDIFSESEKKWFTDGVIEDVKDEASVTPEGKELPKGCAKIVYSNGQRGKWLHPDVLYNKNVVQASIKPTRFKGFLKKETHNLLSEWHVRYFELRNGYLSWWITVEDGKKGSKPQCTLELVGLELKVAASSALISIRTASSRGVVYNFDAKTGPGQNTIEEWVAAFKQHAAFANRMFKFKQSGGLKKK